MGPCSAQHAEHLLSRNIRAATHSLTYSLLPPSTRSPLTLITPAAADLDKAIKIAVDAKVDYPAACNAVEKVWGTHIHGRATVITLICTAFVA